MGRVILHSDLNSFYASVECLYRPELKKKPVVVCGKQSTRHGIILAKNEIAKRFGVRTGEAIWEAQSKCPNLVLLPPNYSRYLRFSELAMSVYRNYTDKIESFGIDECWMDITESTRLFGNGESLAHKIKEKIKNELGITVSVGVSYNKIFAKLGSDLKKPDEVTVINRDNFKDTVWPLPVNELLYVGPATKRKLNRIGIFTIGDLANTHMAFLVKLLGKWGETIWAFANGYDATPVNKTDHDGIIKSIGNSLTAPRDLTCDEDVKMLIYVLSESVGKRLRKHNLKGKTVQISIKANDLSLIERQAGFDDYTYTSSLIAEKAFKIFTRNWDWSKNIRLLGVRAANLVTANEYVQLSLFSDGRKAKRELLDRSIDSIRSRFGHYSVQRALLLRKKRENGLNINPVEDHVIHPISFFKGHI